MWPKIAKLQKKVENLNTHNSVTLNLLEPIFCTNLKLVYDYIHAKSYEIPGGPSQVTAVFAQKINPIF